MSKSTQNGKKKNVSTLEGKRRLGDLLAQAQRAHSMNQEQFAEYISRTSNGTISEGQLQLLITGLYKNSSQLDLCMAIAGAKVLKHKNGEPFTVNDIAAIVSEKWNPFTDEEPPADV